MLCTEIMYACRDNPTIHINTMRGQNLRFFNVKAFSMCSSHYAFKYCGPPWYWCRVVRTVELRKKKVWVTFSVTGETRVVPCRYMCTDIYQDTDDDGLQSHIVTWRNVLCCPSALLCWVCWTSRRFVTYPDLYPRATFLESPLGYWFCSLHSRICRNSTLN